MFPEVLALLSDAFHNLSDVFSLIISYIAIRVSKKKHDENRTYGYVRVEILAALFNLLTLFLACAYIVYESIQRLSKPEPINVVLMLSIAIIGLLGNAVSILILHRDAKKSINIKSAFLHLLGDTLSSVGVIIVGVVLYFNSNLYILDTIISFIIVIYIIKQSFSVFMESINILMQGKPKWINLDTITEKLKSESEIIDVHHIHVWSLTPEKNVLDAHVVVDKENLIKSDALLCRIKEILAKDFGIKHVTIQIESVQFAHTCKCEV